MNAQISFETWQDAFIPIAGMVAAALAVVVGLVGLYLTRRVAVAQGTFTKADLEFAFFGRKWYPAEDFEILFALPFQDGRVFEVPLDVSVTNRGDATADDVYVKMHCNKDLLYRGLGRMEVGQALKRVDISQTTDGVFATTLFEYGTVHPNTQLKHSIPITLTSNTGFGGVYDLGERKSAVRIEIDFSYTINFTISHRNSKPHTAQLCVTAISGTEPDIRQHLKQRAERARESGPNANRLRDDVVGRGSKRVNVVACIVVDDLPAVKKNTQTLGPLEFIRLPGNCLRHFWAVDFRDRIVFPPTGYTRGTQGCDVDQPLFRESEVRKFNKKWQQNVRKGSRLRTMSQKLKARKRKKTKKGRKKR